MTALRALIVEDEWELRAALARQLRSPGLIDEIVEEASAEGALQAVKKHEFAVIILDLGLPDRDGLDLLPELLALDPLARIICLTGRDVARTAVRALDSGAAAYLVKPWEREELDVFVRRAVDHYRQRKLVEIARRTAAQAPGFATGSSPEWARVLELARDAGADSRATVLIRGESGTGKEVVASLIHRWSPRAQAPFITTNVASVPAGLIESEVFGHESGAFTSATGMHRGLFELANSGTLFLDEIGEMPLELQPRLLRVLEGQPFRRLGGEREIQVDVRIVAATHRNLEVMAADGRFRQDLLFRLKVVEIVLPPLRERRQDIEGLVIHFLGRLANDRQNDNLGIARDAIDHLTAYDWPGNVRELRNVIERAAVLSHGERIEASHLPANITGGDKTKLSRPSTDPVAPHAAAAAPAPPQEDLLLETAIRKHIERTWSLCRGNLSHTARALGVSRVALRRRLRDYRLLASTEENPAVTKRPAVTDEPPKEATEDEDGRDVTGPDD